MNVIDSQRTLAGPHFVANPVYGHPATLKAFRDGCAENGTLRNS